MKKFYGNLLENECKVLTQIYVTYNYKLFGKITGNRNVSESHINKIRQSLKKRQILESAILVVRNPKFDTSEPPFLIVEGQHRWSAISRENLPLSFVILNDIDDESILEIVELLNTSSMEWDVTNFMGSKCELGNENYIRYKQVFENFDFEHEIIFYTMKKMNIIINHVKFKEGLLVFSEETQIKIKTIFTWLEKFLPVVEKYGKRYYLKALLDLYFLGGVNLKRLEEIILRQVSGGKSDWLLYSGSVRQSLNHLVLDLYNTNLRKNLIGITSLDRLGNKYKLEVS